MLCKKIGDKLCAGNIYDLGNGNTQICVGEKIITKNPRNKYRAIIKSCSQKTGKVLTKRIRNPRYKSRKQNSRRNKKTVKSKF